MVHSNTELLTDYWRARIPAVGCPARASVDPTHFLDLLPQVFILGRAELGRYGFRLVGDQVSALHGRNLRGEDFGGLWSVADRPSLQSAMEGAVRRRHPLVLTAFGRTQSGSEIELEILLAPLAGSSGAVDRYLGLFQPLTPLARLDEEPLYQLSLGRIGLSAGADMGLEAPRLRLASLDGRRIA
jgi:hypothetical protein